MDHDGDLENDPYTTDCSGHTDMTNPHAYADIQIHNGKLVSKTCIEKQPGKKSEIYTRFVTKIPIISVYSDWSAYSSCSKTCGSGEQSRTRVCEGGICSLANPSDLIETTSCNEQDCIGKFH